jgi:autophagy-related protein 5
MNSRDVIAHRRPPPFYVLASRNALLPIIFAERCRESFAAVAPDFANGWWFEHKDIPLRWHLPVGVLFDLLESSSNQPNQPNQHQQQEIPFRVVVRFYDIPRHVLPCRGESDSQTAFFNSLKQALHLINGSSRVFMELSKSEQDDLWSGVISNRYFDDCKNLLDRFYSPEAKTMKSSPSSSLLPIRLLVVNEHRREQRFLQIPIPTTSNNNNNITLTLRQCIDLLSPGKTWEKVWVQGVCPSLDAPIQELCHELCAFDLWLYIVAKYS